MENPESDTLWAEFLRSIYDNKEPEDNEEEEEVNDPEYVINEDLLQMTDEWDFRDIEVHEWELEQLEEDNELQVMAVGPVVVPALDPKHALIEPNAFDARTVKILVTQFSQHIQLLSQTYVQSFNSKSLESVAQNANSMLTQMNDSFDSKANPIYSALNIKAAIRLISQYPIDCSGKALQSTSSWRTLPVTKENQKIFVSNPDVFLESWLLPFCRYYEKPIDKSKTVFTLAEDHLIALGLEQFTQNGCTKKMCYRYIKQLLLPNKTVAQIRTHIKNIKRRSNDCNQNPIMYYRANKRAPETQSGVIDPKLNTYSFCKNSPEWYKKSIKARDGKKYCIQTQNITQFGSKSKKFKSGNTSQTERKKIYFPSQQSPVKQTISIVKKYKLLNRINPLKPNYVISKPKKCSNNRNSSQIEIIDISDDTSETSNGLTQICLTEEDIKDKQSFVIYGKENIETKCLNQLISNEEYTEKPLNEEDVEFDDESDLAALMTASSTITAKNKNKSKIGNDLSQTSILSVSHMKKENRKSLAVKQRESTLQLLSFECNEIDPNLKQKEELLVQNYLEKVRKCLTPEDFIRFLTLLSQFHQKRNEDQSVTERGLIKELFCKIEDFLKQSNVNKDIISEFVLFLSAEQAEECGKMFDYLYWKRFFNFVRKLEIYSSVDPQVLHRLLRCLNQLKQNDSNLDKTRIRATVSRVLNGHSYLMHQFSSLFLDEKPSKYLFEDEDFDQVLIDGSDDEDRNMRCTGDERSFENINIPESDDELKYGTNECPCRTCHTSPSQAMTTHCTSCSIRFIGGRVYLTQNHKKLGLAQIHFEEQFHNSSNKLSTIREDMTEEEICVGSDNEIEFESNRNLENSNEKRIWTISDDKMLLELCRSKVVDERHNELSEEVFEEVANKLSKDMNEVIARFNKLMELFASEQESQRLSLESDL